MAPQGLFVPGVPSFGSKGRSGYLAGFKDPAIDQLVAAIANFWKLDEASGSRADAVGGQTLSQMGTVTSTTGINGNAGVFSAGNCLTCASSAGLQTGNIDFTIAARVYVTSVGTAQVIAAKGATNDIPSIEYGLVLNAAGSFEFDIWNSGTPQTLAASKFGVVQVNKWYDVIAWCDTTTNTMNIEVNGISNSLTRVTTPNPTSAPFAIGGYADNQQNFIGNIDDVAFSKSKWSVAMRQLWRRKTYPFTSGQSIFDTGQLYTDWGGVVSGTTQNILIPTKVGLSGTVVLYTHGAGESYDVWLTDPLKAGIRDTLLRDGHIICASLAHGDMWGNDQSVTDYVNLYNQATSRLPITRTLLIIQSMGGLAGLYMAANASIPVKGVYAIYPVCNLANMFSIGWANTQISAAYGIAGDGSDYSAKTAGHDPALFNSTQLARFTMPMRFTASYADTVVARTANTDTFRALIAPYAAESGIVTTVGEHGDATNFIPSDVKAFFDRCPA